MALQQASMQPSVIDIIRADHQRTNERMMELEKRVQGRPTSQHPVHPTIKAEVLGHMAAEEKLLYPLLENEMRQKVQEAIREHDEARRHLEHLTTARDMLEDEWARHLQMLKQAIQHHVQEEESEVLPAARQVIGDQTLRELAPEFKRMEEQQG